MKQNLIILNTHPIQYFAPLFAEIEKSGLFNLVVWYCSKHGLNGEQDLQFRTSVKWDIPLLNGYQFKFLRNHSIWPGINKPYIGLINLGIISKLFLAPKSILIVHGWNQISCLLFIFFGRLFGHTVCIRSESPAIHEVGRTKTQLQLRRFIFKNILFRNLNYFLYIGQQNKEFYLRYGARENQMIFTPYSVNNKFFKLQASNLKGSKQKLKSTLGISPEHKIILFCGKFIAKKRPLDLLKAYVKLRKNSTVYLIFMGDGELRNVMETFILNNNLNNIILTGFVNQSQISKYYSISDLLVMCSDVGETWGLAVNEAMNFGLPIITYDMAGCAYDLIDNGKNGFIIPVGDIDKLAVAIEEVLKDDVISRYAEVNSGSILNQYSYEKIIQGLSLIIQNENTVYTTQ